MFRVDTAARSLQQTYKEIFSCQVSDAQYRRVSETVYRYIHTVENRKEMPAANFRELGKHDERDAGTRIETQSRARGNTSDEKNSKYVYTGYFYKL